MGDEVSAVSGVQITDGLACRVSNLHFLPEPMELTEVLSIENIKMD